MKNPIHTNLNKRQILSLPEGAHFGQSWEGEERVMHCVMLSNKDNPLWLFFDDLTMGSLENNGEECEVLIDYINDDGSFVDVYTGSKGQFVTYPVALNYKYRVKTKDRIIHLFEVAKDIYEFHIYKLMHVDDIIDNEYFNWEVIRQFKEKVLVRNSYIFKQETLMAMVGMLEKAKNPEGEIFNIIINTNPKNKKHG